MRFRHENSRARGAVRCAAHILLTAGVTSVLIFWGWNTAAVALFEAPQANFHDILGLLAIAIGIVIAAGSLRRRDPDQHRE